VTEVAEGVDGIDTVLPAADFGASEDATFLMKRVQEEGGLATYLIVGTDHPTSHHTRRSTWTSGASGTAWTCSSARSATSNSDIPSRKSRTRRRSGLNRTDPRRTASGGRRARALTASSIASRKIPVPSAIRVRSRRAGKETYRLRPAAERQESAVEGRLDDGGATLGRVELHREHQPLAAHVHDGVGRVVAEESLSPAGHAGSRWPAGRVPESPPT